MDILCQPSSLVRCCAVGRRSLYLGDIAWIWCVATEEDEWGTLAWHLDCEEPPGPYDFEPQDNARASWLWFELDANGNLADALGMYQAQTPTWLMKHGIAPEQPFLLRAEVKFWRDYEYGTYESDIAVSVVKVEPWPSWKVAEAWEGYWGRWHLMSCLGV